MAYPDNTPNLFSYIHFKNPLTDRFVIHLCLFYNLITLKWYMDYDSNPVPKFLPVWVYTTDESTS